MARSPREARESRESSSFDPVALAKGKEDLAAHLRGESLNPDGSETVIDEDMAALGFMEEQAALPLPAGSDDQPAEHGTDIDSGRGLGIRMEHRAKRAFLSAFVRIGTISGACGAAGCGRTSVWRWMRDPSFAMAFGIAKNMAAERLEAIVIQRVTMGDRRYQFDKDGNPLRHPITGEPYYETSRSDLLSMFVLKALKPDVYRDRLEVRKVGELDDQALELEARAILARSQSIDTEGKDV